jgi:hypothetical protein
MKGVEFQVKDERLGIMRLLFSSAQPQQFFMASPIFSSALLLNVLVKGNHFSAFRRATPRIFGRRK